MKAILRTTFDRYGAVVTGHIEDVEMYEDVKIGKRRWKPALYSKITHIRIPKEVFEKLLGLDIRSEWISVDERLPEEGVEVLALLDVEPTRPNRIIIDRTYVSHGEVFWTWASHKVTHWMYLPEISEVN